MISQQVLTSGRSAEPQALKGFRGTTHRWCGPEQTLHRISPLLRPAGITRDADITGLDRIGIPVTLAIRPNARLLVGSSGKGSTRTQAHVSGLMEALEMYHAEFAENADVARMIASHDELAAGGGELVPLDQLPLMRHAALPPGRELLWANGFDICRGANTPVPWASVHLGLSAVPELRRYCPPGVFACTTNGLASGNIAAEAVAAGLYEVIERDAISLWWLRRRRGERPPVVDLPMLLAIDDVAPLVDRCLAADLRLRVTDLTNDLNVPAYGAALLDRRDGMLCVGHGAHLDPVVAMVRAITEAAQSRAVSIAGSRDDNFTLDRRRRSASRLGRPGPAAIPRCSDAGDTFDADLRTLLRRLERSGLDRVIVTDLRQAAFGLDVVKVWVPGLEDYVKFSSYAAGPRARRIGTA